MGESQGPEKDGRSVSALDFILDRTDNAGDQRGLCSLMVHATQDDVPADGHLDVALGFLSTLCAIGDMFAQLRTDLAGRVSTPDELRRILICRFLQSLVYSPSAVFFS